MTTSQQINPYQPPETVSGGPDPSESIAVTFVFSQSLYRHAEARYLLHWHPHRLLFASLLMIAGCVAVMNVSYNHSLLSFLTVILCLMMGTSAIYTALVHKTKKRLRRRMRGLGLMAGRPMTLQSDPDRITLSLGSENHDWPNQQVRSYRTARGLLVCLEPLLFVFVPEKSNFPLHNFKRFAEVLKSRLPSDDLPRNEN